MPRDGCPANASFCLFLFVWNLEAPVLIDSEGLFSGQLLLLVSFC